MMIYSLELTLKQNELYGWLLKNPLYYNHSLVSIIASAPVKFSNPDEVDQVVTKFKYDYILKVELVKRKK